VLAVTQMGNKKDKHGGASRSLEEALECLAPRLGLEDFGRLDAADRATKWAADGKLTIRRKVWDDKTRSWKYPKIKAYEWSHQFISVSPSLSGPAKYEVIETVKGIERLAYRDAVGFIVNWHEFERLVEETTSVATEEPSIAESPVSSANEETAPAPAPAENAPVSAESVEPTVPEVQSRLPRTGFAGRPTARELIEGELSRRIGELKPGEYLGSSISGVAGSLSEWLSDTHHMRRKTKTIANTLAGKIRPYIPRN
jgi:hypothetical protein